MNIIKACSTNWNELDTLLTEYFTELKFKNDGFFNSKIIGGEAYALYINNELSGFISIGDSWDKGKMLNTFYVIPQKRMLSNEAFQTIIKEFDIEAALVASNDAHFVSLAFEQMNEMKTTFDMQAYNFICSEPACPAEFGMEYMIKLNSDKYSEMQALTDGLWEGCFDDPAFTFYAIKKENTILGYGSICKMQHNKMNVDVGNFTLPEYRKNGVGRSLIINLSNIAISEDFIPTAGCWYKNMNSILTLKSSGYIPENRIFYVRLK